LADFVLTFTNNINFYSDWLVLMNFYINYFQMEFDNYMSIM